MTPATAQTQAAVSTPTGAPGERAAHALQCMEIWGGMGAIDDAVSSPGLDVWVYAHPHKGAEEGGDVHYVSMCGSGRIARLCVADVAGHGGTVADVASSLRGLMRRHINTPDMTRFMRALNAEFGELESRGRFATAVVATYLAPTDHLIVCNAGHPPPVWWSAKDRAWRTLDEKAEGLAERVANIPLGVIAGVDYEQFAAPLAPGDLVLFFTDGLVETRDASGRMLGSAGLLSLLRGLDAGRPAELLESLRSALAAWRGGGAVADDDDLTLVLLHHNAGDPGPMTIGKWVQSIVKAMGLRPV